MTMDRKFQVFISSTYEDLKSERSEVVQALLEANCIPQGMELFPASSLTQWEFIKRVIDDCDVYVVILAGRYGSLGFDDEGRQVGYTEMEFDYAVKSGKPVITLLYENPLSLPSTQLDKNLSRFSIFERSS